jgi:hypothetical protein
VPAALAPFIDRAGRLRSFPKKVALQQAAVVMLAERFVSGHTYSEAEVNTILDAAHTFHDHVLLRRCLVDWGHLERRRDGSQYWRSGGPEPRALEAAGG